VGMHQADLDAEDQERASQDLVDALEATGAVTPLNPAAFSRAIAGRESIIVEEALLSQGRDYLATGKSSYNNALDEEAKFNLEAAIEALTSGIAGSNTTRDLWEAWVYMAGTQMKLEDEEAATAAFEHAVSLDPDRALDSAYWAPSIVANYEEAGKRLSANTSTVAVTGMKGGTVWLDGVEHGAAPSSIADVRPGTHHVVVRAGGLQAYQRVVVPAEGGGTITVDLTMGPPNLGESSDSLSGRASESGQMYKSIGKHAEGVDLMLMAGADESNLMLQLYDVRTNSVSKPFEIPVSGDVTRQAVDNVGGLINRLDAEGTLPPAQRDTKAVALGIGDNQLLAQMLTQPAEIAVAPITSGATTGPRKGTVWAIVGASVGVAALTAGGVLLGTGAFGGGEQAPVYDGTILIGPF
jgi:hypothetical protein